MSEVKFNLFLTVGSEQTITKKYVNDLLRGFVQSADFVLVRHKVKKKYVTLVAIQVFEL